MKLVEIPNGKIKLRDDRKKAVWEAEVPSFRLMEKPVTQEQYVALVGTNPSKLMPNPILLARGSQMLGASTICWGMFGSGAGTYMTPKFTVRIEFSEAVAGATKYGVVCLQIDAAVIQHIQLTT